MTLILRGRLYYRLPSRREIATILSRRTYRTKATFDLSQSQPSNSHIDTSHITAKVLDGLPSDSFRLYTNFLSEAEQVQLLRASLQRLDEIRVVSRSVKQRRKALTRQTESGTSHMDFQAMLSECFLPQDCYDFSEASPRPFIVKPHLCSHSQTASLGPLR